MNTQEVAQVIREYGQAMRGDWSDVDGRSELVTMEAFAAAVIEPHEYTLAQLRLAGDLCPTGAGHWTDWCDEVCGSP